MIEYILARPFVILFCLSAFLFCAIDQFAELHYSFITQFVIITIFCSFLAILFWKRKAYILIFSFIILVLFIRIVLHLNELHSNLFPQDTSTHQTLAVLNCNTSTKYHVIDAEIISKYNSSLVRINIPIKAFEGPLYCADTIICNFTLTPIKPCKERYFNCYNNFLLNEHIYYTAKLIDSVIKVKKANEFSLISFSQKTSQRCKEIFLARIPDERTANLMVALLLGDKSSLDKNIKNDFITTGTSHILAVSGLQLGMIYAMMHFFINFFRIKPNSIKQKFVKLILLMILVWAFTFISGLSASVIRAAVMLSFLEIGLLFKRNSDSVNSLFSCGFIMIFYNPCTLYDVGFQLSFTAVLSILLFNTYIVRIVNPNNNLLCKIRDLISVTISVQVLVTPISIYYFQQFPLYFLLSNILWVPLSFLLMILGIILVLFNTILPLISNCIGYASLYLCKIGLMGFEFIHYLPGTRFDGLWIYKEQVVLYILTTILVYFSLKFNSTKLLISSIGFFLLIPVLYFIRIETQKRSNELIIYSEENALQVDIRNGMKLFTTNLLSKLMHNYRSVYHISTIEPLTKLKTIQSILSTNQIQINTLNQESNENDKLSLAPFQKPVILSYSPNKDSSNNTITSLIINSSSKKLCNSEHSNLYEYDISINGPFTLKF